MMIIHNFIDPREYDSSTIFRDLFYRVVNGSNSQFDLLFQSWTPKHGLITSFPHDNYDNYGYNQIFYSIYQMNWKFPLIFMFFWCLFEQTKKLVFIQELFRHGARYPIYPKKNDFSIYAE